MASTRAEALARYARANRVRDITHVPRYVLDIGSACEASALDELGQAATACLQLLQRRALGLVRLIVLGLAVVSMTPALPALLS